jgi:hypothetical protein
VGFAVLIDRLISMPGAKEGGPLWKHFHEVSRRWNVEEDSRTNCNSIANSISFVR